jgi:ABC-type uncharacterized transport system permease subunit
MNNPGTTIWIIGLTLLAGLGSALAIALLRRRGPAVQLRWALHGLVLVVTLGSAAVFAQRACFINRTWEPLISHVDGLLLIATLLGAMMLFIQTRPRLTGLAAFGLPLLTLLLAWAICASAWTYRLFDLDTLHPVWRSVHLTGVYLGTFCGAVAALAGGMFLYVRHRLRHKDHRSQPGRLASLEALETLVIRAAAVGFALLTVGLIAGVILNPQTQWGAGWWHSPKIIVATTAWLIYALVMNVRFATHFRGARAAGLALAGFVLLLVTYAIATALPGHTQTPPAPAAGSTPQAVVAPASPAEVTP